MHRVDGPGTYAAIPDPRPVGKPGFFGPGVPEQGIPATTIPYEFLNMVQEELAGVAEEVGLHLDKGNNKQLAMAIKVLVEAAIPRRYELCEFYYFRHPTLKPGMQPAQGGLLANAATLYPAAWAYLQTTEGKLLCKTEAEWQAMTTATWATLADGTKVGWNGIGGAPFYAPNTATGALRLPDLRGMYAEAAGFDGLGVGGVHGDYTRRMRGELYAGQYTGPTYMLAVEGGAGVLTKIDNGTASYATITGNNLARGIAIDTALGTPTASKNAPRAWGALACVYLGAPE